MMAVLRATTFVLAACIVSLGACDVPVEPKAKSAAGEVKGDGKSSDAKADAPTAIVSPDNPYQ
jgi:hypothetical protein